MKFRATMSTRAPESNLKNALQARANKWRSLPPEQLYNEPISLLDHICQRLT